MIYLVCLRVLLGVVGLWLLDVFGCVSLIACGFDCWCFVSVFGLICCVDFDGCC